MSATEEPPETGPGSRRDAYSGLLGMRVVSRQPQHAVVEMLAETKHCNDLGIVHGGALVSLADAAVAVASNARPGDVALASALTIHYLASARAGDLLTAEAVEEDRVDRLGGYSVRVRREAEVIATALATTVLAGRRAPSPTT